MASVKAEWLLPLTDAGAGITAIDAARIGTAGYTALLLVDAITEGGDGH